MNSANFYSKIAYFSRRRGNHVKLTIQSRIIVNHVRKFSSKSNADESEIRTEKIVSRQSEIIKKTKNEENRVEQSFLDWKIELSRQISFRSF